MKKSTFLISAMMLAAPAISLAAGPVEVTPNYVGPQIAVTPLPLPSGVSSVQPPQGRVDLDGTSMAGYPMGVTTIGIVFNSGSEVVKNPAGADKMIAIYIDGSETPRELLPGSKAYVDAMGFPTGGFKFERTYDRKGVYKIVVPEGIWLVNETPSPEVTLMYEITQDYVITPQAGVVDQLTEAELIFPSSFKTTYNSGKMTFYKLGSTTNKGLEVIPVEPSIEGEEQNTFKLIFNNGEPVTDPGTYYLDAAAGAFDLTWYGEEYSKDPAKVRNLKSDRFMVEWIVPELPTPAIKPENGSKLFEFTTFEVIIPDKDKFSFYLVDDKKKNFIYPADEEWFVDPMPVAQLTGTKNDAGNVTLALLDGVKSLTPEPGNYVLRLGKGLYNGSYNGNYCLSAPYEYRFTIIKDPTEMICLTPAGAYDELSAVELRFPNAGYVVPNPDVKVTLKDEAGKELDNTIEFNSNSIAPMDEDDDDDLGGASLTVEITPAVVAKGKYTLDFPKGAFICDEFESLPVSYVYEISGANDGIEDIIGEDGTVTVYTLGGVVLYENAEAAVLDTLEPGIYVVNGVKIAVRK